MNSIIHPGLSATHIPMESGAAPASLAANSGATPVSPLQSSTGYPLDTSKVLLGLMSLSQRAEQDALSGRPEALLDGVISKKILRSLLSALQFRDKNTVRHSRRVALLATGLARYLGWEEHQVRLLEVAALLHDIGKIGVPDSILFKPGRLNPDEVELLALHYQIGIDVLQACRVDHEVLDIVSQAHVRYGSTTNSKLVLGATHMGARILAIADAYESLSSDQVFRDAVSMEEIHEALMKNSGTLYDGNLACAMKRWVEVDRIRVAELGQDFGHPSQTRGPQTPAEIEEAKNLCHIFSYLYILESLYDGFFLVDSDLRFMVWNRAAEEILGQSAKSILGQTWTTGLIGYRDHLGTPLSADQTPLRHVLKTSRPTTALLQIHTANQAPTPVEIQSIPLLNPAGQMQGMAEIYRNVNRSGAHRPHEFRELKLAASRDALTQLDNRGSLEAHLAELVCQFSENPENEPFSVIFVDADHFKKVNDNHGHEIGDQVLVGLARLLRQETYSGELVGRYGGEEFVILCPGTRLEDAFRRAERLRLAIQKARLTELPNLAVTASFGVSEMQLGDSVQSVLKRADQGLYRAKHLGRDRTIAISGSELESTEHQPPAEADPANPFLFRTEYRVTTNLDLMILKFRGYLQDAKAKLLEVNPELVSLELGSVGLIPFWGSTPRKQPVRVDVKFQRAQDDRGTKNRSGSPTQQVTVEIRPLGWCRDRGVFRQRANQVAHSLRQHFMAESSSQR